MMTILCWLGLHDWKYNDAGRRCIRCAALQRLSNRDGRWRFVDAGPTARPVRGWMWAAARVVMAPVWFVVVLALLAAAWAWVEMGMTGRKGE